MAESRDEIAKLEALYASNPEGRVFTHLAEAYRKAGELDRARAILQEGLAKHPAYASAHVVLGRVLADQQNTDEAEGEFRRVLELDPHNHVALRCLGDIARAAGRRDDALRYFSELRHLDPNNDELGRTIDELSAAPAATVEEAPPETVPEAAAEIAPETVEAGEPEPESAVPEQPEAPVVEAEAAAEPEPVPTGLPEEMGAPEEDLGQDLEFDWVPSEDEQPDAGLPGDLGELAAVSTDLTTDLPAIETPEDATTFADVDLSLPQESEEPLPTEPLTLAEPVEAAGAPQPEETGEVLTETIAELYRAQGLYDRAADVYRALVEQRPDDAGLKEKLQEVEALARGPEPGVAAEPETWTPEPWEAAAVSERLGAMAPAAPPFEPTAPEVLEPEAEAKAEGEPEPVAEAAEPEETAPLAAVRQGPGDEAEAWIAGATVTAESAPTPYAWDEQPQRGEPDGGPPIREYFRRLLAWRPAFTQAAGPQFAASEEAAVLQPAEPEPEPAFEIETEPEPLFMLDEEMADTQELFAEPSSAEETVDPWMQAPLMQEEPAEPWEVAPTSAGPAEQPTAPPPPVSPPSPAQSHMDASAAFDEWFDAAAPAPAPEPPPVPQEEPATDEDDDLEMFRSWLQSLKK